MPRCIVYLSCSCSLPLTGASKPCVPILDSNHKIRYIKSTLEIRGIVSGKLNPPYIKKSPFSFPVDEYHELDFHAAILQFA
jgi:hypothetical protein